MPDYQQSKIYKIVSPNTDKIYIGSTTKQYLSSRMAHHICLYKKWLNGEQQWSRRGGEVAQGAVPAEHRRSRIGQSADDGGSHVTCN